MNFALILNLLFIFFYSVKCYNVCVVGGSSGLGKELIYQSLNKNKTVLALTSGKNPITIPCRINSFNENNNMPILENSNLTKDNYWKKIMDYKYENLIFTTSAKPFEQDYSDILFCKIMDYIPSTCKKVAVVSAYGAGESLNGANIGINIMNNWYLKDVYRSKNTQEMLLKTKYKNLPIHTFLYRPKALSYGKTNIKSVSRMDLANEILTDLKI